MTSIFSIFKDKSLWAVAVTISVLFLIVPIAILEHSNYFLLGLTALIVIFVFRNIPGFSCIILAFSLMTPHLVEGTRIQTGVMIYIPYILVLSSWFILFIFKTLPKLYNFSSQIKLIPVFILLSIAFTLRNNSYIEMSQGIFYIVSTTFFLYICLNDPISLRQFYAVLDIIFYFNIAYIVKEVFFHTSPYQTLYKDLPLDLQQRAKGLTGHPLLLSSFLSFYNVTLISKILILKKWDIFNLLLLIPAIVFTSSKTALLLVGISWILYIILVAAYKRIAFYIVIIAIAGIGIALFSDIEKLVSKTVERIKYSSIDQRIGSYSIATQLFINSDFLGIGSDPDAMRTELNRVNVYQVDSKKFDVRFLVFDNSYLTALAYYGIFGPLIFVVYIQPVYRYWKYRKDKVRKTHLYTMLIILAVLLLQNFSFDSFVYFSVNAFYFILIAVIIKELKGKTINMIVQEYFVEGKLA